MVKPHKIEAVDKLRAKLGESRGIYLADFKGLTVARVTELRNRCRAAGVEFEVVKNTLARRAFDPKVAESLAPYLVGPTAIATSREDEVAPAKVIADFVKEFELPRLKAGVVDGSVVHESQVNILAALPGKDVLLGRFAGGLKSPMQKLHGALSSPLRNLATVLKQYAEKQA